MLADHTLGDPPNDRRIPLRVDTVTADELAHLGIQLLHQLTVRIGYATLITPPSRVPAPCPISGRGPTGMPAPELVDKPFPVRGALDRQPRGDESNVGVVYTGVRSGAGRAASSAVATDTAHTTRPTSPSTLTGSPNMRYAHSIVVGGVR